MPGNTVMIESAPVQVTNNGSIAEPTQPPVNQQTTIQQESAQYAFFGTRIRETIQDLKS